MKHVYKITLLFIVIAFVTACTKDNPGKEIVGTWYLNNYQATYYTNGTKTQENIYSNYNRHYTYHFNSDGSGYEQIDTIPGQLNFNYNVSGQTLTVRFPVQDWGEKTYEADTTVNDILSLTSTSLSFTYFRTQGEYKAVYNLYFSKMTGVIKLPFVRLVVSRS